MSEPMPGRPDDFIVRLEGLRLDDSARNRIADAIQDAVLAELGRLDLAGTRRDFFVHCPRKWNGRWIREVAKIPEGIGEIGQALEVQVHRQ